MVEKAGALLAAQNLTKRALQLLDDVGAISPAIHLQMALDILTDAPVPRNEEEADAMLNTKEARALLVKMESMPPASETPAEGPSGAPSPEAVDQAAAMVRLHGDKALGRVRMQLHEALRSHDTDQINYLSSVCAILMQAGYA